MATIQDLLNSGMSREEINALLSQSTVSTSGYEPSQQQRLSDLANPANTIRTPGFDPMGITGRGEPYMPPQELPVNMIRNNTTGRVFAPETPTGQPSQSQGMGIQGMSGLPLDYSQNPVKTPYGTGQYLKGDSTRMMITDGPQFGKIVDLGRDTAAERTRTKENLALDKARADIAHTNAATAQTGIKPDTTPVGYRKTVAGNLEAIPGGPADQKIAGQYNADVAQLQSSQADLDRLATSANELLKTSNLGRITGLVGALPNIPGMEGADAQAKLNTLKSQVGFGVLQAMRNASKTGGALGNVSDAEGKRLEANLAALENAQSEKQMRESLQKIVDFSAQAKDRLSGAFNLRHNPENASTPMGSQGGGKGIATPSQKYSGAEIQAVALRTGKTEAQVREDMRAKGLL